MSPATQFHLVGVRAGLSAEHSVRRTESSFSRNSCTFHLFPNLDLYGSAMNTSSYSTLPPKPFRSRKTHSKSRTGCDSCKRRRKKCDERTPICSCCSEQGLLCHYGKPNETSLVPRERPSQPLRPALAWTGLPGLTTDEAKLFHHFHAQTLPTLGSSSVQSAIECCLPAAVNFDFFRHSVCTLAASHTVFLSENRDSSINHHFDKALCTFRQRLTFPITCKDLDAILTSCVLLGMITFSTLHETPRNSQGQSDKVDLRWLTSQIGLRAILFDTRHLLGESSWASVYKQDAPHFRGEIPPILGNGDLFSEYALGDLNTLLGISPESNQGNNVYDAVLQSLIPLLSMKPSDISLTQLMAVMYRFKPEFYELLERRDLRALLLLAYWLGLMCRVDLWWVSSRARSECMTHCEYLDSCGDRSFRKLLVFPAQCCNYQLQTGLR